MDINIRVGQAEAACQLVQGVDAAQAQTTELSRTWLSRSRVWGTKRPQEPASARLRALEPARKSCLNPQWPVLRQKPSRLAGAPTHSVAVETLGVGGTAGTVEAQEGPAVAVEAVAAADQTEAVAVVAVADQTEVTTTTRNTSSSPTSHKTALAWDANH